MELLDRIKVRLKNEDGNLCNDEILNELLSTAKDRLTLRSGEIEYPKALDSIAVDVVVKLFRRQNFEGITSENNGIDTKFADDILSEYKEEIEAFKASRSGGERSVRFL